MGRLGSVVVVTLAVWGGLTGPAVAAFKTPRSCQSGKAVFRDGRIRLFFVEGSIAGEQAFRHYVCSARLRRPRQFNETSPGLDETLSTFRRSGRRVAFLTTLIGGESFDQVLGWVDVHTGRRRLTDIRDEDEDSAVKAVVADESGGLAYLQDEFDDGAQRIGYARRGPAGGLGVPRPRAVVPGDRVIPRSLAVADGTITWRTRSGAAGSVAALP